MATTHKLCLVPEPGGDLQRHPFPLWWDPREFFSTFRGRSITQPHLVYEDSGLMLTGCEASEWDERSREAFVADPRASMPVVRERMASLRDGLRRARWVIVESSEWESGLG